MTIVEALRERITDKEGEVTNIHRVSEAIKKLNELDKETTETTEDDSGNT